ncbi:MAG: UbiD family decarboxylase [Deltaproteobacteria bacterium]|nr:UbiD family decarboxylase [Deltaproteobacteria bacterium]
MAKDLRTHLRLLRDHFRGEICTIKNGPLSPAEGETSALLYHLERQNKWPCVIFEHVTDLRGERWPGAVVFSEATTWRKIAVSLDILEESPSPMTLLLEAGKRGQTPIAPKVIPRSDAPAAELEWQNEDADLTRLPAYRKEEGDARPGWVCGVAVARDPDTDRYNCSWHRHLVHGAKASAVRINYRHLWDYMQRCKNRGQEEMPLAFVFGHHPAFSLAAGSKAGLDVDEYSYAGGLLGEPLRLTPSLSFGNDLLVPADAELIVEGYVHLTKKKTCGPWSDFLRYYSPATEEPVFRPTAISMRRDPLFLHSWTGHHEVMFDCAGMIEVYMELVRRHPRLKAVNCIAPMTFVLQYSPEFPGEAQRLAAHAFGALGDKVKNLILVDEDINPFDPAAVWFSIATRVDASTEQVTLFRDLLANRQDASRARPLQVGGIFLDSTKPSGRGPMEISAPAREVLDRIRLEDYLTTDDLNALRRDV